MDRAQPTGAADLNRLECVGNRWHVTLARRVLTCRRVLGTARQHDCGREKSSLQLWRQLHKGPVNLLKMAPKQISSDVALEYKTDSATVTSFFPEHLPLCTASLESTSTQRDFQHTSTPPFITSFISTMSVFADAIAKLPTDGATAAQELAELAKAQ